MDASTYLLKSKQLRILESECTNIRTCVHTYIHWEHLSTEIRTNKLTHPGTQIRIHAYMPRNAHTHAHTHTHTHTLSLSLSLSLTQTCPTYICAYRHSLSSERPMMHTRTCCNKSCAACESQKLYAAWRASAHFSV
jgi:hypothetical protein